MQNLLKFIEIFVPKKEYLERILYIEYKPKKLITKQQLISNTFDKYFMDLKNSLLSTVIDETRAVRRFKNRLLEHELKLIKNIFSIYDLDEVVLNCDKPYFLHLLYLIDSLNNIKYIVEEQFKCTETQYNYDNYKNKTDRKKEKGEAFDRPLDIQEAKLHRGIVDEYKDDDIVGSIIIKSLGFQFLFEDELDLNDMAVIANNQNFQKQFSKVNFTKNDLYRGFASQIFWNYAHRNYAEYKKFVTKNNMEAKGYNPDIQNYKDYKKNIPMIKKSDKKIRYRNRNNGNIQHHI